MLYVVYICQKSYSFVDAFIFTSKIVNWLHFSWATLYIITFAVSRTVYEKFDVKQSNDLEISPRSSTVASPESCSVVCFLAISVSVLAYNFRDIGRGNDNID